MPVVVGSWSSVYRFLEYTAFLSLKKCKAANLRTKLVKVCNVCRESRTQDDIDESPFSNVMHDCCVRDIRTSVMARKEEQLRHGLRRPGISALVSSCGIGMMAGGFSGRGVAVEAFLSPVFQGTGATRSRSGFSPSFSSGTTRRVSQARPSRMSMSAVEVSAYCTDTPISKRNNSFSQFYSRFKSSDYLFLISLRQDGVSTAQNTFVLRLHAVSILKECFLQRLLCKTRTPVCWVTSSMMGL